MSKKTLRKKGTNKHWNKTSQNLILRYFVKIKSIEYNKKWNEYSTVRLFDLVF